MPDLKKSTYSTFEYFVPYDIIFIIFPDIYLVWRWHISKIYKVLKLS